jgi:dUTP pyrophosphatase
MYLHWVSWRQQIAGSGVAHRLPLCYVAKTDVNAVLPTKAHGSDVGYDITIIKVEKVFTNGAILFDTGIKIKVKHGFYAEVIPRSSLARSGYMLSNSVGIIDPNYSGNIFVTLTKVIESVPPIELPFKCGQLVFREQVFMDIEECTVDYILQQGTSRGDGGFGSTDI